MMPLKHESAAPPAERNGAEIFHSHDRATNNDHSPNIGESLGSDNQLAKADTLAAVRRMAGCGLYIMPVTVEDKKPLVDGWRNWSRPLSADRAADLFSRKWDACGAVCIGLMTGGGNRLTVVDVDDAAEDSLRSACERFGNTPVIARTGGGWHLFYEHNGEKNGQDIDREGFGFRVDIRGAGGFVVVAPSLHKSGRKYRWHRGGEGGLFDLPRVDTGSLIVAANVNRTASGRVKEGARTEALMAEFRRIRPLCQSVEDAVSSLLRFRDAWLDLSDAPYSDAEVRKVALSCWQSYDFRKASAGRQHAYVTVREADLVECPELFGPRDLLNWLRLRNPHGSRFAVDGRSIGKALGVTRDKIEGARAKLVAAGKLQMDHKGTGRKGRDGKRDANLYSFVECSAAGADFPSQCITVNPSPPEIETLGARSAEFCGIGGRSMVRLDTGKPSSAKAGAA